MSVLGNVSIRLTEEQGMLLDVARGFVRDQAPIEAVRALSLIHISEPTRPY